MRRSSAVIVALFLLGLLVLGALDESGRRSWMAGLIDPVVEIDHLVILVGVGLWAGKLGGSALRWLPAAFLIGAFFGYVLAAGQLPVPLLEALVRGLVIGSMLLVGVSILIPIDLSVREATGGVAMFGGCHGYLHWLEVGSAESLWFGLGSVVTAAALMAAGVAMAVGERQAE